MEPLIVVMSILVSRLGLHQADVQGVICDLGEGPDELIELTVLLGQWQAETGWHIVVTWFEGEEQRRPERQLGCVDRLRQCSVEVIDGVILRIERTPPGSLDGSDAP